MERQKTERETHIVKARNGEAENRETEKKRDRETQNTH
jgi:hypothetical protein